LQFRDGLWVLAIRRVIVEYPEMDEKCKKYSFSPTTVPQEKKSRSIRTTDLTVTNWRRCCVFLFSPITCWDEGCVAKTILRRN
jgi:hypothetical protein